MRGVSDYVLLALGGFLIYAGLLWMFDHLAIGTGLQ